MRKIFYVIGGLSTFIVAVMIILFAVTAYKASGLDQDSKDYVETALLAISSNWDSQELMSRASPEFKNAVQPKDIDKLFSVLVTLGRMTSHDTPVGEATVKSLIGKGTTISAQYTEKPSL